MARLIQDEDISFSFQFEGYFSNWFHAMEILMD